MKIRIEIILLFGLLVASCVPAVAGGPLYVGGSQDVSGLPYRWNNATPVSYWTDLGMLGSMTKQQADQFTADCFGVWHAVPTANISFNKGGDLSIDVTASNFLSLDDDPNSELNRNSVIVYDADGGLIDALYGSGASNSILGFAAITDGRSDGVHNYFIRGLAVLNGKWVDGVTGTEIPLEKFKEVFVHEFGHFAGLDHSQVNVEVLDSSSYRTPDRLAGLPTMFPFLLNTAARPTLARDDVAAISQLYPAVNFPSTTGKISGRILFSDELSQAQGVNVIARLQDNPGTPEDESLRVAVSSFSGFLFTASAGNLFAGYAGSSFGSRNQSMIGYYEIPGLAQGNYSIEIEAVNPAFTGGSGVGPIGDLGFQFPVPGTCTKEFLNLTPIESATDLCTDKSLILVTPGAVINSGTDIILNGTSTSYDAWESSLLWTNDGLIRQATHSLEVRA